MHNDVIITTFVPSINGKKKLSKGRNGIHACVKVALAEMPSKEVTLPKGKMWVVHKFGVGVARACVFAVGFRVYICLS